MSTGEAFAFFADALNLEAITPPWLHFKVMTPQPIAMGPGTLIEYRLRLHSIPLRWLARIEFWEPGRGFADIQLRGPYRLWRTPTASCHTRAGPPCDSRAATPPPRVSHGLAHLDRTSGLQQGCALAGTARPTPASAAATNQRCEKAPALKLHWRTRWTASLRVLHRDSDEHHEGGFNGCDGAGRREPPCTRPSASERGQTLGVMRSAGFGTGASRSKFVTPSVPQSTPPKKFVASTLASSHHGGAWPL